MIWLKVSNDIRAVDDDVAGGVTGGVGGGVVIGTNSCRNTNVIIGPFPSGGPPVCWILILSDPGRPLMRY